MPTYQVSDDSGTRLDIVAQNREEAAHEYVNGITGDAWNGATEIEVVVSEIDSEGAHSPTRHTVPVRDPSVAPR